MRARRTATLLSLTLVVSCGSSGAGGTGRRDAGSADATGPGDSAASEASPADAPVADATDGAISDGGPVDASPGDAGARDAEAGPVDAGLPLPSPLYGVTVDTVSNLSGLVASLKALPRKATTRIVFDPGPKPAHYAAAIAQIGAVSFVMGELLDSSAVKGISVAAAAQRASDYLAAFPTGVDLWEVGNEINGNWLGTTSDVVAKMTGAFDLVKAAGGRTELTLYGCSDSGAAYDMIRWVDANVPARMRSGLDYVLVSYYEGDCAAPRTDWTTPFQQLRQRFPAAGLGFGEVGYVDKKGQDLSLGDPAGGAAYLAKYYGMTAPVPGYVGGYFWWYFAEDMVPATQPMWAALAKAW